MKDKDLKEIFRLHKCWIRDEPEGRLADLRGADLQEADFQGVNLRRSYLRGADLQGANLQRAILHGVDLQGADLRGADLRGADLWKADLQEADLQGADLRKTGLRMVDFWGADLCGADLRGADLRGASFRESYLDKIRVAWSSNALISEILWRTADTESRQMLATFIGRKVDWCWDQYLHPEREWALGVLRGYVTDGDSDVPEVVRNEG